jgi:ABC-type branched-subunit amino acid transport system ATPase component
VIEVYLGADGMLAVEGLNQFYGGSHILRDVSFEVPRRAR